MANIRINRLRLWVGHIRPHLVENARSCSWANLSPRYYFSDSGLHMSHFDSCQLTLIWLANVTLNDCRPWQPCPAYFRFYVELVSVTYYISLYIGARRLVFYLSPRDGHVIIVSGCLILTPVNLIVLIRMAYITKRLLKLCKIYCDIWHRLTWSVCTGGRTLRHNQIFSDG